MFGIERGQKVHDLLPLYRDLLAFSLTDYSSQPFEPRFLNVNQRHHSLAFVETGKNAFHHLMMELFSFDDVGQVYDLANADGKAATTLARHPRDFLTSFYPITPSQLITQYT